MRGSENLKILINGKYSGQMARSAADALNMMPANLIHSVEIITTPSAKYDAEGAAGVINIITKKGKSNTIGTLELSLSNLEQMLNPRFSFSKNKWSINLSGHLHLLRRKSATITDRTIYESAIETGRLNQSMEKDNTAPHGSADFTIDYALNETTELNFGLNTWIGKWPDDNTIQTTVLAPNEIITEWYHQNVKEKNAYLGTDFYVGLNKRFKNNQRFLTVLLQHSPSMNRSDYNAQKNDIHDNLLYRELNKSSTKNSEWTFQLDYQQPLDKKGIFQMETGGKLIYRDVHNDFAVKASDTSDVNNVILQPLRSDIFSYSQNVYAVYGMLKASLSNNWYLETGLRMEYTDVEGSFKNNGSDFKNAFFNLIPTATVSKKLNERNTLTLSYTKRLTRPYIWDLNPNVDASDLQNIRSGNSELVPESAHQAELAYGLNIDNRLFMSTAIFWKQTNNAIIEYMETDTNGVAYTRKQNLASNRQFGINFSATYNPSQKWTFNGNVNINHFNFNSSALIIFHKGWGNNISLNTSYKLTKTFTVQVFGEYSGKRITLLGNFGDYHYYSFAFKKEMKKIKTSVTLNL